MGVSSLLGPIAKPEERFDTTASDAIEKLDISFAAAVMFKVVKKGSRIKNTNRHVMAATKRVQVVKRDDAEQARLSICAAS